MEYWNDDSRGQMTLVKFTSLWDFTEHAKRGKARKVESGKTGV